MIRRQYVNDIEAVAAGRDPKAVLRDADAYVQGPQPSDHRDFFRDGLPREAYRAHPKWKHLLGSFISHAGQPDAVREACAAALGVEQRVISRVDL